MRDVGDEYRMGRSAGKSEGDVREVSGNFTVPGECSCTEIKAKTGVFGLRPRPRPNITGIKIRIRIRM